MQESIVFLLRVCRRKESSRSLSHLLMSFLLYIISNLSARFLRSTLGRLKEKYDYQDLTILISPVRNNFIKNLFTAKSRVNFFIGQASRPNNKIIDYTIILPARFAGEGGRADLVLRGGYRPNYVKFGQDV